MKIKDFNEKVRITEDEGRLTLIADYECEFKGIKHKHHFEANISAWKKERVIALADEALHKARQAVLYISGTPIYVTATQMLLDHLSIWYPNFDEKMASNRGENPSAETDKLRKHYSGVLSLMTRPMDSTERMRKVRDLVEGIKFKEGV